MSYTRQQTFDKVARHLLTQSAKSVDRDGCAYRGLEGLVCAAGCLIPKGKYRIGFEGQDVNDLVADLSIDTGRGFFGHSKSLCKQLQRIHDYYPEVAWKRELKKLAKEIGLDSSVCDEFQWSAKKRWYLLVKSKQGPV